MISPMDGLQLINPLSRNIGKLPIARVLPTVKKRTLGPFVFLDHMKPHVGPASDFQVPPHPHIGLCTVTYLFEGELRHRDSVGSDQRIQAGAVNWMTAGRGIVHSERPASDQRGTTLSLHGLQAWVALPRSGERIKPSFMHYPSSLIPVLRKNDAEVRLIAGTGFGMTSPVLVASPLIYAVMTLNKGARVTVPVEHSEQGIYLIGGEVELGGGRGEPQILFEPRLCIQEPKRTVQIVAKEKSRLAVIGGEPLAERRYLDWNFCSSDKKLIEQAKEKYRKRELGVIEGEEPQLPLPEDVG